jgi:hypothetical protein
MPKRLRRQLLLRHPNEPVLIAALAFSHYGPRGRGRVKGVRVKWTPEAQAELWNRFSKQKEAKPHLDDIAICRTLSKQEPYSQNLPGRDLRSIKPKTLAARVRGIRSVFEPKAERI